MGKQGLKVQRSSTRRNVDCRLSPVDNFSFEGGQDEMLHVGKTDESAELSKLRNDITALEVLLSATEQKLAHVDEAKNAGATAGYLDSLRGYESGLTAWPYERVIVDPGSTKDSSTSAAVNQQQHCVQLADLSNNGTSLPTHLETSNNRRCREEALSTVWPVASVLDTRISHIPLEPTYPSGHHHEIPSSPGLSCCTAGEPSEQLSIFSTPTPLQGTFQSSKMSLASTSSILHHFQAREPLSKRPSLEGGVPGFSAAEGFHAEPLPQDVSCRIYQHTDPSTSSNVCSKGVTRDSRHEWWEEGESLQRSRNQGGSALCRAPHSKQHLRSCLLSRPVQETSLPFCPVHQSDSDVATEDATSSAADAVATLRTHGNSLRTESCTEARRKATLQTNANDVAKAWVGELECGSNCRKDALGVSNNYLQFTPSMKSVEFPETEHYRGQPRIGTGPTTFSALDDICTNNELLHHLSSPCRYCQEDVDDFWKEEPGTPEDVDLHALFSPACGGRPWEDLEKHTAGICTGGCEPLRRRFDPVRLESESRVFHALPGSTQNPCPTDISHLQRCSGTQARRRGNDYCKQPWTPKNKERRTSHSTARSGQYLSIEGRRECAQRFTADDSYSNWFDHLSLRSQLYSPLLESDLHSRGDIRAGTPLKACESNKQQNMHDARVDILPLQEEVPVSTHSKLSMAGRNGHDFPSVLLTVRASQSTGSGERISEQVQPETKCPEMTEALSSKKVPLTCYVSQQICGAPHCQGQVLNDSNKEFDESCGGPAHQPSRYPGPSKDCQGQVSNSSKKEVAESCGDTAHQPSHSPGPSMGCQGQESNDYKKEFGESRGGPAHQPPHSPGPSTGCQGQVSNDSNKDFDESCGDPAHQPSHSPGPPKACLGSPNGTVSQSVPLDGSGAAGQPEPTEMQKSDSAATVASSNAAVCCQSDPKTDTTDTRSPARVADVSLSFKQEESISRQTLCVELKEVQDMLLRLIDDAGSQPGKMSAGNSTLSCLLDNIAVNDMEDSTSQSAQGRKSFTIQVQTSDPMKHRQSSSHPDAHDDSAFATTSAAASYIPPPYCDRGTEEGVSLPLTVAEVRKKLEGDLSVITSLQQTTADKNGSLFCSMGSTSTKSPHEKTNAPFACQRARTDNTTFKNCIKQATSRVSTLEKEQLSSCADENDVVLGDPTRTKLNARTERVQRRLPGGPPRAPLLKFYKHSASPPLERVKFDRSSNTGVDIEDSNKLLGQSPEVDSGSADSETSTCTTCYPVHRGTPVHSQDKSSRRHNHSTSKTNKIPPPAVSSVPQRSVSVGTTCTNEGGSCNKQTNITRFPCVPETFRSKQIRPTFFCSKAAAQKKTSSVYSSPTRNKESICCPNSSSFCGCLAGCGNKRSPSASRRRLGHSKTLKAASAGSITTHYYSPSPEGESARRSSGSRGGKSSRSLSKMNVRGTTSTLAAASGSQRSGRMQNDEQQRRSRCIERGRNAGKTVTRVKCQCPRTRNQSTSPLCYKQQHDDAAVGYNTVRKDREQIRRRITSSQGPHCPQEKNIQLLKGEYVSLCRCADSCSRTRQAVASFKQRPTSSSAALVLEASTCWSSPVSRIASGLRGPALRRAASSRTLSEKKVRGGRLPPRQASTSLLYSRRGSSAADYGELAKMRSTRARAVDTSNTMSVFLEKEGEEGALPDRKSIITSRLGHREKNILSKRVASAIKDSQARLKRRLSLLETPCKDNSTQNPVPYLAQNNDLTNPSTCTAAVGHPCDQESMALSENRLASKSDRGGCYPVPLRRALDIIPTSKRPHNIRTESNSSGRAGSPIIATKGILNESRTRIRKTADAGTEERGGSTRCSFSSTEATVAHHHGIKEKTEAVPLRRIRRKDGLYHSLADGNCRKESQSSPEMAADAGRRRRDSTTASDRCYDVSPSSVPAVDKRLILPGKARAFVAPTLTRRRRITQKSEYTLRNVPGQARGASLNQVSFNNLYVARPAGGKVLSLAKKPPPCTVTAKDVAQKRKPARRVWESRPDITRGASHAAREEENKEKEGHRLCANTLESEEEEEEEESGEQQKSRAVTSPVSSDSLSVSSSNELQRGVYAYSLPTTQSVEEPANSLFPSSREEIVRRMKEVGTEEEEEEEEEEELLGPFPESSVRATVHASIKQRKSEEAAGKVQKERHSQDKNTRLIRHTNTATSPLPPTEIACRQNQPALPLPLPAAAASHLLSSRRKQILLQSTATPDSVKQPLVVDETFTDATETSLRKSPIPPADRFFSSSSSDSEAISSTGGESERQHKISPHIMGTTAPKAIQWESSLTKELLCSEETNQLPDTCCWCSTTEERSTAVPSTVSQTMTTTTTSRADGPLFSSQLTYVTDKDVADIAELSHDYNYGGSLSEEEDDEDLLLADKRSAKPQHHAKETHTRSNSNSSNSSNMSSNSSGMSNSSSSTTTTTRPQSNFRELLPETRSTRFAVSRNEEFRKGISMDNTQLLASTDGIITTRRPILFSRRVSKASSEHISVPKSSQPKRNSQAIRHAETSADSTATSSIQKRKPPPPVLEFNMKRSPRTTQRENKSLVCERENHFLAYLAENYGKNSIRKRNTYAEEEDCCDKRSDLVEEVVEARRSSPYRSLEKEKQQQQQNRRHHNHASDAVVIKDAEKMRKNCCITISKSFGCASNRAPILGALEHVCLAGKLNIKKREKMFLYLEGPWRDIRIFIILLKDSGGPSRELKALYALQPSKGFVKVAQISPAPSFIDESMIKHLYRYDCGSKTLQLLEGARTIGPTTIAATLRPSSS